MKKYIILAIVTLSLSAWGQMLTNINNAKIAGAVIGGLSQEAQHALITLTRANNKASRTVPGWTTMTTNYSTIDTNLVLSVVTNNPPKKLEATLLEVLSHEKISRLILDHVSRRTNAIATMVGAPVVAEAATDPNND